MLKALLSAALIGVGFELAEQVKAGAGVFLTIHPAAMAMGGGAGAGPTMVMVQTAYDPAKLSCPAGFDPKTAATTSYQGRKYYFCSVEDRDKFLTNPAMSLSMMPPKQ